MTPSPDAPWSAPPGREAPRGPGVPVLTLATALLLVAVHLATRTAAREFGAVSWEGLHGAGWFRLFSASVLHASWWHLAGNLLLLSLLGMQLERRLGWGPVSLILLASALGGALGSAWLAAGASIGASGAVYGLLAAWILLGGHSASGRFAPQRLPWQLWALLAGLLLIDNLREQVDWVAHATGAASGLGVAGAIRVVLRPGSPRPSWGARLALPLMGLYGAGWAWGAALYLSGQGARTWISVNNRAWEVALSDADGRELERWRDRMIAAVRSVPDRPEFADTLATLHHRLDEHAAAVALERDVSWQHERSEYVDQLARFAWAAHRAGELQESAPPLELHPDGSARWRLEGLTSRASPAGLEVDALVVVEGRPRGLLRLALGPEPSNGVTLPEELMGEAVVTRGRRVALVMVDARPPRVRPPRGAVSARYWPVAGEGFDAVTPAPTAPPTSSGGEGGALSGGAGS